MRKRGPDVQAFKHLTHASEVRVPARQARRRRAAGSPKCACAWCRSTCVRSCSWQSSPSSSTRSDCPLRLWPQYTLCLLLCLLLIQPLYRHCSLWGACSSVVQSVHAWRYG